MKASEKPRTRFEGTAEINADHYPIDKSRFIRLLSHDALKRQKKGVVLFSVGGREVVVGKDQFETESFAFGRSIYGELLK